MSWWIPLAVVVIAVLVFIGIPWYRRYNANKKP